MGSETNQKMEPPAARAPMDDDVENRDERNADEDDKELGFGPVANPGAPRLDGNAVGLFNPFLKSVEGQLQDADGEDEDRGEEECLKETRAGRIFSPIAIFR